MFFRFFVLLIFSSLLLLAATDKEVLERAEAYLKSDSKNDQFRAYNDFKNLYLRSIMSNDESLKADALKGIVQSGRKLHIDISQYAQELQKYEEKSAPKQSIQKTPELKVSSSHKLSKIAWQNDRLVLHFDKDLDKNQINYFTIHNGKEKQYRYVFDIHASMLLRSESLHKEGIDRIKLAQFDPRTLRLVIQHHHRVSVRFKVEKNQIIINIQNNSYKKTNTTPAKKKQTSPSTIQHNKVIVIDPGHGGKDPGAVGYRNYREKIVVQQISERLSDALKAKGYKVYMTRTKDRFIKLSARTKFANAKNADIFVSIHANAIGGKSAKQVHGIETYFLSTSRSKRAKRVAELENSADLSEMNIYGKQSFLNTLNSHNIVASNKLAIDLQKGMLSSLSKSYKVKDMGVREGPFWVLVGAQMPSVLVEVGFITHPTEARRLVKNDYQQKMAQGMADGIERYFINSARP